MGKFQGEKNASAAIFIHKDEGILNDELWNDILKDISVKYPIHVELITKKDDFLNSLRNWNSAQKLIPDESVVIPTTFTPAFLVIHAHMGDKGIYPVNNDPSRVISWQDVTQCIQNPVSLVWLFGCKSDVAKRHWTGKSERLLTCTTVECFRKHLPLFKCEVRLRRIVSFDRMLSVLRKKIPTLSYFTHDGHDWVKSFE